MAKRLCARFFSNFSPSLSLSLTYDLSTYGSIEVGWKYLYLFSKNVSVHPFLPFPPFILDGKILSKTCFELKGDPLPPPLRSRRVNRYIPAAFRLYSRKFHGGGRRISRDGKKGMKGFEITATNRSMEETIPLPPSMTLYILRIICVTMWFRHGFSSLNLVLPRLPSPPSPPSSFRNSSDPQADNKGLGEVATRHMCDRRHFVSEAF